MVFATKINNRFYIQEEHGDITITDSFDYPSHNIVKKKYFDSHPNVWGIRSVITFIEGEYREDEFWNKYGLDPKILEAVRRIQGYQKVDKEIYNLIPIGHLDSFGKEYLLLLKTLHNDYDKYIPELNITALRYNDYVSILLKRLSLFHNPYLRIQRDFPDFEQHIYKFGRCRYLRVNYTNEKTNGLIASYDRGLSNIDKNNPIKECMVSRFNQGMILSMDYNAFHPRIAFFLAGYRERFEEDFYKEILKEYNIEIPRDEFKELVFKTIYGGKGGEDFAQKHFPKLYELMNEVKNNYNREHCLKSITGRRRQLSQYEIGTKLFNSYIQTTHADVINEMLYKLDSYLKNGKKSKLIGIISDNFLLDVKDEDELGDIVNYCKENLQNSVYLDGCHLKLNFSYGKSWADVKTIKL